MISNQQPLIRQADGDVDFVALLEMLWRYKWFIAGVTIICGLIAVFLALSATEKFRAEIVVTEAAAESMGGAASLANQFGGLASLAGINLGRTGAAPEAQAVLRSRYLVEEFVRRNNLVDVLLSDSARAGSLWFAVNQFRDGVLGIASEEDRGTITISIEWKEPAQAANWANDFVALANEILRSRALADSARNIEYLKDQIAKTDVVEMQRVMYRLIESETKTQMLANARMEYAFRVIDPAVAPEKRVWPRRTLMVMTGGVFGVILGVFLALVLNVWRKHRASA